MQEKRVKKRNFYSVTLEYTYNKDEGGARNCETSSAITTNISEGGIGIYTDRPLDAGQNINVFSGRVKDRITKAEVRWCRRVSDALFKVGLMFTDSQPAVI